MFAGQQLVAICSIERVNLIQIVFCCEKEVDTKNRCFKKMHQSIRLMGVFSKTKNEFTSHILWHSCTSEKICDVTDRDVICETE